MKTYVINLPQSSRRLAEMQEKLAEHPYLQPVIVEAVDGRVLSADELDRRFDRERFRRDEHRYPRPGEVGCALSHQKIYNELAAADSPALVLEDDVYFVSEEMRQTISDCERWLSTSKPRLVLLGAAFLYKKGDVADAGSAFEGRLVSPHFYCYGAFAYALNPAAARVLKQDYPRFVADCFMKFRHKIELKAMVPLVVMPATEEQSVSTITSGNDSRVKYGFFCRLHFFMREKLRSLMVKSGLYKRQDTIEFRKT